MQTLVASWSRAPTEFELWVLAVAGYAGALFTPSRLHPGQTSNRHRFFGLEVEETSAQRFFISVPFLS
jgi:hypothetical protein